ncbi:MAG TPA: hypothetical protein ENK96_10305 [Desulfobulbaceae bacterium]|nr:hypothetical protein [Desulfobulbaceae bacterium]
MQTTLKCLLPALLVFTLLSPVRANATGVQDIFTFIFPAPALYQSLQAILPLPIEQNSSSFKGQLSLDSIDKLRIHDDVISLHGIVSGKELSMHTEIAGQKIKLKLGHVTLPLSCDLHLRFDKVRQQLFVTPQFKPSKKKTSRNGDAIMPLLAAFGGHEYPLDLSGLQSINPTIGKRDLPLKFKPVQVTTKNNQLILGLRPEQKKSH